ncbi:MAG: AMP-binding protein [Coriobacteriia bacterium]|nr:AMP-binding protein [Coriobacteriia bacterium]
MDQILKKYCPRIDFESYEDFMENFRIEEPEGFNFSYDVVDEWARLDPEKRALVWCDDTGDTLTLTFAQVARLSDKLANVLTARGLRKGSVVMLLLRQRWEFWIIACALWKIGAIMSPGTIMLTTKDLIYRAESSGAEAIITLDDDYAIAQVDAARAELPGVRDCILVGCQSGGGSVSPRSSAEQCVAQMLSGAGEGTDEAARDDAALTLEDRPGWLDFDRLVAAGSSDWTRPVGEAATTNDDTLALYFTSGTTGPAKMVRQDMVYPLGHIITAKYWHQVKEDTLHCTVSDSGWAKFGWGKLYGQWICGATVFTYDTLKFSPTALLQKLQDYRVHTFCVPPTMYRFMLQEDVASYDLSSVEVFTTAGEPLNADVNLRWKELTGKEIREGFGQTESVVFIANWPWIEPRPGSLGKPAPLYNVKLLLEDGTEAEDGQEGAICVTGLKTGFPPGLFRGYYKNPEKTAEALGGDAYNTGDMAWRDVDGYYTFVGRNDDVIKCSGYRIGPFEVESALVSHPAVVESAVTAFPDPIRGLVVKASIILARGYEPSPELARELQEHVKKVTAPYKYPRIIDFVDDLPKTVSGKIKRAEIRDRDRG